MIKAGQNLIIFKIKSSLEACRITVSSSYPIENLRGMFRIFEARNAYILKR